MGVGGDHAGLAQVGEAGQGQCSAGRG
jgi:hypothetical protein